METIEQRYISAQNDLSKNLGCTTRTLCGLDDDDNDDDNDGTNDDDDDDDDDR